MQNSSRLTGDKAILARRYAGALYELANESRQTDKVSEELIAVKKLWNESEDLRFAAFNLRLPTHKQVAAIKQIVIATRLSLLTGNFLTLLAQNRRLSLIEGTIDAFFEKLAEARGEFTADVCVAHTLNSQQEEKLRAELQKLMGGTIKLNIKQIPALLGGLTVKIGSRLIDASLRGKLARLEKQLKAQQEAA